MDARLLGRRAGGDSTYWQGLLGGFAEVGLSAMLLTDDPTRRTFAGHECFTVRARWSRWWSLVAFPLAARRLGANVIHTQYSLSPLVGRRGVTTVHDVSFLIEPRWFRPKDRVLLRLGVGAAVRRARSVVTVSYTSAREIEEHLSAARGKIVVTPLGLNPGVQPRPVEEARAVVERELGIEPPFLLAVGSDWPRKNIGLAREAAALLPEDLPHKLVIAGGAAAQPSGRVLAPGYVLDEVLSSLYTLADLLVVPSRHEGFGLPLLEAFACQCPVLSSRGGALPEVGASAVEYVDDWEPRAWATAIERLLRDSSKLEELRGRGPERLADFDWRETAKLTLHAYRMVAE